MPPENANEPNPTMAKNQDYLDKLAEAAEDLNEVLGCDPAIETEGVTKSDLEGKIKEASGLIDPDEDVFKPATISVLESLGVSPFEAAEELAEEEEEPEDEEEQEGIDDPTLEEVIASTKKRAALKQIVREEPAFEPLRKKMSKYTTVSSLKAAMKAQLEKANGKKEPEAAPKTKAPKKEAAKKEAAKKEAPKKEAPAPKAKADKKPAANGYSRIDSVCDAIKTDKVKDFKDLVAISNNIYIEKKGPSADNVAEARTMARYVVKTLRHFGVSVPEE